MDPSGGGWPMSRRAMRAMVPPRPRACSSHSLQEATRREGHEHPIFDLGIDLEPRLVGEECTRRGPGIVALAVALAGEVAVRQILHDRVEHDEVAADADELRVQLELAQHVRVRVIE